MVQPRRFEANVALFLESGEGFRLEVARGVVPGLEVHHHTGANPSVAASTREVITFEGGNVVFLTVPDELRIKAGGNVNDIEGGSGATTIHVEGLDEKWEYAHCTIVCNGADASASSNQKFVRIWHANVESAGT